MKNKDDSTLLEYTKTAEELRLFSLSEKCKEIAREYERFNIENGVYEFFAECLLKKAKTHYGMKFKDMKIEYFLYDKGIEPPAYKEINAEPKDYEKCEFLRKICKENDFHPDYYWYTLWEIAKAYNCKNGCVVVKAVGGDMWTNGILYIELDWSQQALDCITKEKWKEEAKEFTGGRILWFCLGLIVCLIASFLIVGAALIIMAESGIIEKGNVGEGRMWIVWLLALMGTTIYCFPIRDRYLKKRIDGLSWKFDEHCEKISKNRCSSYNIDGGLLIRR